MNATISRFKTEYHQTGRSADCFVRSVLCNRPYMVSFFKVDLPTFMTLTDKDLKELGISTFGIRKKILVTIQGNLRFSLFFFDDFSLKDFEKLHNAEKTVNL